MSSQTHLIPRFPLAIVLLVISTSAVLADCESSFELLVHNNLDIGAYRITTKHFAHIGIGEMEIVDVDREVRPPDAFHMTARPMTGEVPAQLIAIGDKAWEIGKMQAFWQVQSPQYAHTVLRNVMKSGFAIQPGANSIKCLGTTTADGKDYLTFSYELTQLDRVEVTTLYFDALTRLPVRAESSGTNNGEPFRTTTRYEFDPSIKIEQPPAREIH